MGNKRFMAIHQFGQQHLEQLGVDGFSDELIQDTINSYAESCRNIGCIAIEVNSDYRGLRNFCFTAAQSAEQVRDAHEAGIPRETITEIIEVKLFKPQA